MPNTEITSPNVPADQERYNNAIAKGLEVVASGGSKADAARAIYDMIRDETREVIIQSFIDGATVTEKGAPTYFYNVRRQFERNEREKAKKTPAKTKKKSTD